MLQLLWFLAGLASPTPADEPAVRRFELHYETTVRELPDDADVALLWIPYPPDDEHQKVRRVIIDAPAAPDLVTEPSFGNKALRFPLSGPADQKIRIVFDIQREENRALDGASHPEAIPKAELQRYLASDRLVPVDEETRRAAADVAGVHRTGLPLARSLYDHVVETMSYDKSGSGWGRGDLRYACDFRKGNCTDFHSVFIGYSRALGLPARFEIGFPIPPERGEGTVGGYHCWALFHLPERGWVPLDASEAAKHPEKKSYFFGNHDENRVLFARGRDLVLPGMKGEPLNFFVYPYVEVDGQAHSAVEKSFRYRDIDGSD